MADETFDAVIVGGGTKALFLAMYLIKYGGMSVGIFERRHEIGGCLATEEISARKVKRWIRRRWKRAVPFLAVAVVLVVLGGMREILGQGTLFDGVELLLGDWATNLKLVIFEFERSFLVAVLPPGAFIGLGLLIALKNYLDQKVKAREQAKAYRDLPSAT